ncbi:MAG: chromosomal replication initiator protein DnaA [Defluviitaleaceae bacterium]|nr:chromosomal replication initiator protein DnaA [Defluviitaleaceae bacterium]
MSALVLDNRPKGVLVDLWEQATVNLNDSGLNSAAFTSWIKPLIPYHMDEGNFLLLAKNTYVYDTVKSRYLGKLTTAISDAARKQLNVKIIRESDIAGGEIEKSAIPTFYDSGLRPKFNFNNFVQGKCNEFAYAASFAVAQEPGSVYNPLFLHGDVGLGKTHLMHSIGNFILAANPQAKILYTTSENLLNELVTSMRTGHNQEFRDKYRSVDVLLVDDIQFISDKVRTQEEFFHTFNELHAANKQIVLTSDRSPYELKSLEERMRSRFGSGLIADVTLPDLETRLAILQKKTEMEKLDIDPEVVYFIAKSIASNIRELEGALNTVAARAKLLRNPISVDFAANALQDMIKEERREVSVEYIQEIVGNYLGVSPEELRGKKRTAHTTYARHIAIYLCRHMLDIPLKEIARQFGGRDHSTMIHAVNRIENEMSQDRKLSHELDELRRKLQD